MNIYDDQSYIIFSLINMSTKSVELSHRHLQTLVENKEYKQYKVYIKEIMKQNIQAEKAVFHVLKDIFILQKYHDPLIMFNGLVLYREVLISACMDYICENDFFPQDIHRAIGKICEYKGQELDLEKRGDRFFVDLFNLPYNDEIQKYGYNFVIFALEILKAIATWYPHSYLNEDQKSIFKQIYDDLIQKGVTFPDEKQFSYVKAKDEGRFRKCYEEFMKAFDESESQITPVKNLQSKHPKVLKAESKKDQNIFQTPSSVEVRTKQEQDYQEMVQISGILESYPIQRPKQKQIVQEQSSSKISKITPKTKEEPKTPENELEPLPSLLSESSIKKKEPPSGIRKPQNSIKNSPVELELVEEQNEDQNTDWMDHVKLFSDKIVIGKQPVLQNPKHANKNNLQRQPPREIEKLFQSNFTDDFRESNVRKNDKKKIVESQPSFQKLQRNHGKYGSIDKTKVIQEQLQSFPSSKTSKETPKKMHRTQKSSILTKKTQKEIKSFESEKKKRSSSQKSLPKTQRIMIKQSPLEAKLQHSKDNWNMSTQSPLKRSNMMKMSLSQMSFNRKDFNTSQISRYQDMTNTFYKMRLDEKRFQPSISQFKPLTLQMVILRDQALKTSEFPHSYNPFFQSNNLQVRLSKEKGNNFTLSLRNTEDAPLLIGFKDMSQFRFSNLIQIHSWGNKKYMKNYPSFSLIKNNYLDVKFSAFISDQTFKFLPFDLAVNGENFFLILPITLLDMSNPQPLNNFLQLQQYALKGGALVIQQFSLRSMQLPDFLGGFQFKEFGSKQIQQYNGNIIGACTLNIPIDKYMNEKQSVVILVRMINYHKRVVDLVALVDKKNKLQETFSHNIIRLLFFLLAKN